MDCTHGIPGGSRYCGLCRHSVLAAAGQTRPPLYGWDSPLDKPMPSWFRDAVTQARPRTNVHQPTLEEA